MSDSIALTRLDIAALRKADSVCFDHNVRRNADGPERASFIRAIKRCRPSDADPYATDITHRFEVASKAFSYADGESSAEFTAFHMSHHVADSLATVFDLLRAGDVLTLMWIRSNSSGYIEEAGLYRDELELRVMRNGKALRFKIAVSVTKDNSARMTQVHTLREEV